MGVATIRRSCVLALTALCGGLAALQFKGLAFAADATETRGPDLNITMFRYNDDSRPIVVSGGDVTLSIGINNRRGDTAAHSSVLTVTLPDGLKLKQATPVPDRREGAKGGGRLTWNLGTVPAGAFPRLFGIDMTAARNLPVDTHLAVSATVTTSDEDASLENNTAVFVLRVVPAVADLAVQSDLSAQPFAIGPPIKFTAEVDNWGSVPASTSSLTLTLPPKVLFRSSEPVPTTTSSNRVMWQFGDIRPTGSRRVAIAIVLDTSLSLSIDGQSPESLLKFNFDASTTTTDIKPANNHLEVARHIERAGFDAKVWLSVQGIDTPGELPVRKDVTYTITYGNFGNAPAAKSTVSLSLPDGQSLINADPAPSRSGKTDNFPGGVVSWDTGTLQVGDSKLIKCRVHMASVPEEGGVVMATVSADGTDIDTSNNVAYLWRHGPRGASAHSSRQVSAAVGQTTHRRFSLWIELLGLLVLAGVSWILFRVALKRRGT